MSMRGSLPVVIRLDNCDRQNWCLEEDADLNYTVLRMSGPLATRVLPALAMSSGHGEWLNQSYCPVSPEEDGEHCQCEDGENECCYCYLDQVVCDKEEGRLKLCQRGNSQED